MTERISEEAKQFAEIILPTRTLAWGYGRCYVCGAINPMREPIESPEGYAQCIASVEPLSPHLYLGEEKPSPEASDPCAVSA